MADTNQTTEQDTESPKPSRSTSVNRVTLVGRLAATPELRMTSNGTHVTTVRVATNDREQAEFHDVVLWAQKADFATQYMAKGRLVYVEGRLQGHSWEASDGTKRRSVEIIADRFQSLERRRTDGDPE